MRKPVFANIGDYHTYEEFQNELEILQNSVAQYSKNCKDKNPLFFISSTIGETVKGNPISAFAITANKKASTKVLFTSQIHGMEFIGAEMNLALMKAVTDGYFNSKKISDILHKTKLYFIPLINVDAYKEILRLLEQSGIANVRKNSNGVDLNRNFATGFGTKSFAKAFLGESFSKMTYYYNGAYAFSEPETIALKSFTEKHRFKAAIAFHSFSNYILFPYYHTVKKPKDYDTFLELGLEMRNLQKIKYKVMQGSSWYFGAGCEHDWLYDEFGTFAFLFELGKLNISFKSPLNLINPFVFCNSSDVKKTTSNNIESCLYLADIASEL